jgi:flagellin-specific chaperone FliS
MEARARYVKLYQSDGGKKFLDELPEDLIKMIYDYINPIQWAVKFSKQESDVKEVKDLLQELKW